MFKKINIPLLIVGGLFIWGKECYGTKTTKMDKVPSNDVSAYEGTPGFVGNPLIPLLTHHLSKQFRKKFRKKKITVSMRDIQEMLNIVKQNDKYKEKDIEEFVQALLKDNKDDRKKISEVKWRKRLIRVKLFPRKSKSRKRNIQELSTGKKILNKVVGFIKSIFNRKKKPAEEKARKKIIKLSDEKDEECVFDKFDKLFSDKDKLVGEIDTIIKDKKYFEYLLVKKEIIDIIQIMKNRYKSEDTHLLFKGMANCGLHFTARILLIMIKVYDADTFVPNLKRTLKHCMFFDDALYEARRKQNSDNRLAHPPISEVIYIALYEAVNKRDHKNVSKTLINMYLNKDDATFHNILEVILKLIDDCDKRKIMTIAKKIMNNIEEIRTQYVELKESRDKLKSGSETAAEVNSQHALTTVEPNQSTSSSTHDLLILSSEKFANKLSNLFLKNVEIPNELTETFLKFAESNSKRKLETCGLLFGKSDDSCGFTITHLLIPKQKVTSTSCLVSHEEEVAVYQSNHEDLTLVGWIHTHPTFEAFLSHHDMHTHYWQQFQRPEYIAIVVSLKYQKTEVYHLTATRGMAVIRKCFDSQSECSTHITKVPLFEFSENYITIDDATIDVTDLR